MLRWLLLVTAACGRLDFDPLTGPTAETPRLVIGDDHACLRTGTELACWGQNDNGQLATGDNSTRDVITPIAGFAAIDHALGQNHTCALDPAHRLYCWGTNARGALGCGASCPPDAFVTAPTPVGDGRTYARVFANDFHNCAITMDGAMYCWGSNDAGELGVGDAVDRTAPSLVLGDHHWTRAALGDSHTCALDDAGALWCWGSAAGGTGTNAAVDVVTPERVQLDNVIAFDCGRDYTCALVAGGALWCWGQDDNFETTFADTVVRRTPAMTAVHATAFAGGNTHACALDGTTATCWGTDNHGQLGTGDVVAQRATSPPVSGAWTVIATGDEFSCAFDATEAVWCWGRNQTGQLGNASLADSAVPVMAHP